jgi:subtilisin family serine protease
MPPILQKISLLSIVMVFGFCLFSDAEAGKLSPNLQNISADSQLAPDSLVRVVVFMEDSQVRQSVAGMSRLPFLTRGMRIKSVVDRLKSFRAPGFNRVKRFLDENSTTAVKRHWIVPAFSATIPLVKLDSLATLKGVKLVVEDGAVTYEAPVETAPAPSLSSSTVSSALRMLNVPYLWSRGLTGKGRLVASFDTGVELSHPALSAKWRGNTAPLSAAWFSKVAGDTLPSDRTGHGTHTMGIMVGSTPLDTFGVAFEAEWITAGVIDQGRPLGATISDILEAFEWALNPDGDPNTTDDVPDVILNSWGIPQGLFAPCDETFFSVIDNVEAAGIVTIFAGGNEGPEPMTMRNPADRATSPLNSFAVGAVDTNGVVADFSSRGPSSCDSTQIKPEVVAPGVAIRSSYKGGGYMYMSGTSMAAPYIAGLVALMRQYNPDATVEEIKNALIQSCIDLGLAGEDNAYGYGLPDASKLLDYLPPPTPPEFSVAGVTISDDGIALPGEQIALQVMLRQVTAGMESVNGMIVSSAGNSISLVQDRATFFFGSGGTTAVNSTPFQLVIDSTTRHGQTLPLQLLLETTNNVVIDTLSFTIIVGIPPAGDIALHSTDRMELTVSDFGQFGFAPGSIYNLQGRGFRYNGSQNLLFEGGIIIGRNSLQLSSAVRDSLGNPTRSDFTPVEALSSGWLGSEGGFHRVAVLSDRQSDIPIPITVRQQTSSYPSVSDNGFLLVRYYLKNDSIEKLTNLYFGFLADFDLPDGPERCLYDETMNMLYQQGVASPLVGLVGLKDIAAFTTLDNGAVKRGFSRSELFGYISSNSMAVDTSLEGDLLFVAHAGPFTIYPGDSVEIALALVGGDDIASLYANASRAKEMFDFSTDITGSDETLPSAFALYQNYPNPFNPMTTISFTLPAASDVSLRIFNILGQEVSTLYTGLLPAGIHQFQWDATDNSGNEVAGGVYFYRLVTGKLKQTRKMLLLK